MDITRNGKYEVCDSLGNILSRHNEYKEAIQSASNQPPGTYTIKAPPETVIVEACEPPAEDPPAEDPPAEDPPAEDPPEVVFGRDNSPIAEIPKPTRAVPQADPAYGLLIQQATDPNDSDNGASWIRNDYSRRQASNADESMYIAVATNGWWWLYDAATRLPIMRFSRPDAPTKALLQGSCEPIWHPTDPDKVYFHPINGGMTLSVATIDRTARRATSEVVADFTDKLPWPDVRRCWMKDEGAPSFDGRYWCFQAETDGFQIRGAFVYDLQEGKVLGTRDLAERPDHTSMSACGKYAVLSSVGSMGTTAYDRDTFELVHQLHHRSEHSDLGLLPNGHGYYIAPDYQSNGGDVFWTDLETGEKKVLFRLYPGGSALHFSAKAYHRPGWVCVSVYAQKGAQKWFDQKVFLLNVETGAIANLCHHRSRGTYYGEPHATISPSGRYVLFNSNWYTGEDAGHCAYQVGVPEAAYEG